MSLEHYQVNKPDDIVLLSGRPLHRHGADRAWITSFFLYNHETIVVAEGELAVLRRRHLPVLRMSALSIEIMQAMWVLSSPLPHAVGSVVDQVDLTRRSSELSMPSNFNATADVRHPI